MSLKTIKENASKTVIPSSAPLAREVRGDGWRNLITGLGDETRDKRLGGEVVLDIYTQEHAEALWRADDFGARIVEAVPNEMTREGYTIRAGDADADDLEEVTNRLDELEHLAVICQALEFERAYGGGGVLIGADDGQKDFGRPLIEDRVKSLDYFTVLNPRELRPVVWYEDPLAPKCGLPKLYELTPETFATPGGRRFVHESRILRFASAGTSHRAVRYSTNLWGDSVFNRVAGVLRDFQSAFEGSFSLAGDFAQSVLKIEGLAELVGSEDPEDASAFRARMRAFDYTRSVLRTAVLDTKEEFERKATPLSGLADLLDKFMLRMAAAADMPVSLLMGQSPAGMNATGAADIRFFYDRVRAMQRKKLRPALNRLLKITMQALKVKEPERWAVKFNPLWQPTAEEEATTRKTNSDADKTYFDIGVLGSHEIRKSRFGGAAYSSEIQLDKETEAAMLAPTEPEAAEPAPTKPAAKPAE